jgi:hypothetical protein
VLRYIQSIKELGIMFESNEKEDVELFDFCDSDWVRIMGTLLLLGQVYFHWNQKNKKEWHIHPWKPNLYRQVKPQSKL